MNSNTALNDRIKQAGFALIAAHNDTRNLICPECKAASFSWEMSMGHCILRCRTPLASREDENAHCGYVIVCTSTELTDLPAPTFTEKTARKR